MTGHQDIYLVRLGEITLKGLNRGRFESRLMDNIRRRLRTYGTFRVSRGDSRVWVESDHPVENPEAIMEQIGSVFGVVSVSPAWRFDGGQNELEAQAIRFVAGLLERHPNTPLPVRFKVETRRGDKRYPLQSPQISARLGEVLLEAFPDRLAVDVHQPNFVLYAEVRSRMTLHADSRRGQRGLPVGTGGRGLLLLSGGIDSPVAGYLMASRGMQLEAVYFHAHPFTSPEARQKVLDLAEVLTAYTGRLILHIVDFADIQIALRDHVPEELLTLAMRRMMLRIAAGIAGNRMIPVLISGDSLGQVASQTLEALLVCDAATAMPVFRPLIGMDKDATVEIARRIGTFDISILPYEDCCTVFVARHPKTHPRPDELDEAEHGLDLASLRDQGLARIETLTTRPTGARRKE